MATSSTIPTAPTAIPTPEEILPPSPPSTPPRISFDPPLFLQRRTAVHAILRQLSSSPRFSGKLRSFLDVGCGTDCLLLRSLIPCEDEIPLERITGIDFDEGLFNTDVAESVAPGSFGGTGSAEDRWRPLDISLLQGSFEHLTPKAVPRHDIIVSTEVIEHLDPQPLSRFAPVLLGKMKPKICVITTPNRDFNKVFEIPFTPPHRSPVSRPVVSSDALPNIEGIINSAHGQPGPCLNLDSIVGGALNQPIAHSVPGTRVIDALEMAASEIEDRKVADTEFMFDDPPSRSVSPQPAPQDHGMHGDSDRRYWRPGIPYPMRHHDHRFEWTRAEFREWAKTAAERFGYDVVFTGVGSLDCGMNVIGSGWAIEKSLEDTDDEFLENDLDCLGRISIGENKVLGEGLEDIIGTNTEEMGILARKAKAAFGDCSQIAVFVIKESTEAEWESVEGFPSIADNPQGLRARAGSRSEGTAKPVFPDAWAPLITPDNWFSLPFFTAPDIRLVCHYSYPFLENEEYPPPYIRALEMVQETFISFLPALVVEEWQKTPATLVREERERQAAKEGVLYRPVLEDMDIDPYDIYEPLSWEVLRARAKAKQREEEQEASRVKKQVEIMGGMKAEDVQVVKMVLGAREVWNCSYKLQRAFRFHYDVFRRCLAGVEQAVVGPLDSNPQEGVEWKTIIDTIGGPTGLPDLRCHSTEKMTVQLRGKELVKVTLNPPGTIDTPINNEYSGPDIIFHDSSMDTQDHTPNLVPDYPTDEEAFWDAWDNAGSCCSIQDGDSGNGDDSNWDGNWYHDGNTPQWEPLKLHIVAAWGLDSAYQQKGKGKGKEKEGENRIHCVTPREAEACTEIDIGDEGVLRVGRNGKVFLGEEQEEAIEWQEGDLPMAMAYFKPLRVSKNYNENGSTEEVSHVIQDEPSFFSGGGCEAEGSGWD